MPTQRHLPGTLAVIAALVLSSAPDPRMSAFAQETVLTLDYYGYTPPDYPWSLELNPGMSKELKSDGWRDYYLSATQSWQPEGWFRLDGGGELHRGVDPQFVNHTELRGTVLGALIWPTQGKYLNLYNPEFNTRFDTRFFFYDGDMENEVRTRFRFQLMGRFTVNDTVLSIGTLYLPWALESYTDLGGDPKERSAYMWRWRVGIGYVVSGFLRTEVHYIASRVRDTTEDAFELTSRTIWLVIRNYY